MTFEERQEILKEYDKRMADWFRVFDEKLDEFEKNLEKLVKTMNDKHNKGE